MGCCASRPSSSDEQNGAAAADQHAVPHNDLPTNTQQQQGSRPLFGDDAARPASSTNSVATSTEHQEIALDEHYNAPLRTHIWRTKAHRRPWTRSRWLNKREEFFHTRVTNRPEIWGSLRTVVELLDQGELETAQGILDASEVTLPTGNLVDGAYDSFGNLYQLPPYVVSAPENMVEDDYLLTAKGPGNRVVESATGTLDPAAASSMMNEKQLGALVDLKSKPAGGDGVERSIGGGPSVTVKARLSDRGGAGQDVTVEIGMNEQTKVLIQLVAEQAGVTTDKIKIAYMGRILRAEKGFIAQGWQVGHVVNALVLP